MNRREINKNIEKSASSWLSEMQGQRNIKKKIHNLKYVGVLLCEILTDVSQSPIVNVDLLMQF